MQEYIKYFIKNHGIELFNNIKSIIEKEMENNKYLDNLDANYLNYIFQIAVLEYSNVGVKKIPLFISRMGNNYMPSIPYKNLRIVHKNSINLIKKYLQN